MSIDPQLLACVRSEYVCLCQDIRHIELGEWRGVPPPEAYNTTMYLMAGLLVIGYLANMLVKPLRVEKFPRTQE